MANPTAKTPSRRKFAPIPIETTFVQYRKTGNGEPTPSPSPKSPSPPPPLRDRERRRFAPQLVESSVRRSRRAGDEGPATKHTDKTDITPYTKHIYAHKAKKRHGAAPATGAGGGFENARPTSPSKRISHTRRESCDDEIAGGVFDLVARDAQRKLQEVALSAFPNSYTRVGGAEHFYIREGGSDDDNLSEQEKRGRSLEPGVRRLSRRNSSVEDTNWAFKEMQEHVQRLDKAKDRISTLDLDNMSIDSPPSDAMRLTSTARQSLSQSQSGSPLWTRPSSLGPLGPIGESHMPYVRPESPLPTIGESVMPYIPPESPPIRPIGESFMPYIPSAPPGQASNMPYKPAAQIPPETGFRSQAAPFRRFGQPERDLSLERARNLHRMRANHSPPMLGKDLVFRTCPSPKQTKLEPDHLWDLDAETTVQEPNRDITGQHGLWRGYCYTSDKTEKLALVERPAMLITPFPPATPRDQHAPAFNTAPMMSEEPTPLESQTRAGTISAMALPNGSVPGLLHPHQRGGRHGHGPHHQPQFEAKGLHMLQGLEERLRKEKAQADLEEKIAAEFDDAFVTQVYNYLSLGYPSMARQYDEELSKISRIAIDDLQRDDDLAMEHLWGGVMIDMEVDSYIESGKASRKGKIQATGHIVREEKLAGVAEEDRCPRWRALKLYVFEWARQHPDLNAISPLAWGVRERRGSWGI